MESGKELVFEVMITFLKLLERGIAEYSEYKILNRTANECDAVKGGVYLEAKGTLKIVSETPYDPSCQGAIMFLCTPNLDSTIYYNVN